MSTGWRVPIRVKLLAVLAVPVLGYVVIATAATLQARQDANEISDQANVVSTAVGPISLTTSLIDERAITALERAGLQDDLTLRIGSSGEARRVTDRQLDSLQQLITDDDDVRVAYAPAVDELASGLDALRADVDSNEASDAEVFDRYGVFIDGLMDANEKAIERIDDRELWQGAKLSELATRQKDTRAVLINALIPVTQNDGEPVTSDQNVEISRALSIYESRNSAIRELATGKYRRPASVLFEALEAADLVELSEGVLQSGELSANQLFDVASYKGGFVYELPSGDYIHDSFRAGVVEILEQDSARRSDAAARGLRIHLFGGTLGLVVTAIITLVVSRSITRPLHSLTQQAIDTATQRLPDRVQEVLETPLGENVAWPELEPIQVGATDEVADVAQALNTMQDAALRLAVEEAILRRHITDSLTNLGQRNQTLVTRQLDFITDLERDETDPDVLANLFYLDHLATRMRRNAESLLVLAGIDPPRKWMGPTAVNDIIRAALGESQEYKRIHVQDVEAATIAGSATTELAHLLAELMENALVFSNPGQVVEVTGQHGFGEGPDGVRTGSGRSGRSSRSGRSGRSRRPGSAAGAASGYRITIKDAGVGMSPEELAQANRRLADAESYTIAPSKYMGHYVAGKLAARNGIVVRLHDNAPARGVTATVDIPAQLLAAEAAPDTTNHLPPLPEPVAVAVGPTEADIPTEELEDVGAGASGPADHGVVDQAPAALATEGPGPVGPGAGGPGGPVLAGPGGPADPALADIGGTLADIGGALDEAGGARGGGDPAAGPAGTRPAHARGGGAGTAKGARAARAGGGRGAGGRSGGASGASSSKSKAKGGKGAKGGQAGQRSGAADRSAAAKSGGTPPRKPRKPRKRSSSSTKLPVKLPVPPPSQPLEPSTDSDPSN